MSSSLCKAQKSAPVPPPPPISDGPHVPRSSRRVIESATYMSDAPKQVPPPPPPDLPDGPAVAKGNGRLSASALNFSRPSHPPPPPNLPDGPRIPQGTHGLTANFVRFSKSAQKPPPPPPHLPDGPRVPQGTRRLYAVNLLSNEQKSKSKPPPTPPHLPDGPRVPGPRRLIECYSPVYADFFSNNFYQSSTLHHSADSLGRSEDTRLSTFNLLTVSETRAPPVQPKSFAIIEATNRLLETVASKYILL